jgi:hypothetical protein
MDEADVEDFVRLRQRLASRRFATDVGRFAALVVVFFSGGVCSFSRGVG